MEILGDFGLLWQTPNLKIIGAKMPKYKPKSRDELRKLVKDNNIYLGDIDTSNITNMGGLFIKSNRVDFSGIELWDTSNVISMRAMFGNALYFNHNINSWDTSKVVDMSSMFNIAERFNQPLDKWNTCSVVNMNSIFSGAKSFNQPLDSWDTSSVVDMSSIFLRAKSFNRWNTSNVVSMYSAFCGAENFNQPLDNWDTSSVEFMTFMFLKALSFNQNIDSWNVRSIRDNQKMFANSGVKMLPKWYKNTPFFSDLDDYFSMIEEIEKVVEKAKLRAKKLKILS